jgi:hypothetical protein
VGPTIFLFFVSFSSLPRLPVPAARISACRLPARLPGVASRPPLPGVRRGSGRAGGLVCDGGGAPAAPPKDARAMVLTPDAADLLLELEDPVAARRSGVRAWRPRST